VATELAFRFGAMLAAVFGLLGVITGGLLNATATHLFARSTRWRSVRQASRLVLEELGRMSIVAQASYDATDEGNALRESDLDLMLRRPVSAAREHMPVLSDPLVEADDWRAISSALLYAEGTVEGFLGREDPRDWADVIKSIDEAEKALRHYADVTHAPSWWRIRGR
jgi:hypothetical protein